MVSSKEKELFQWHVCRHVKIDTTLMLKDDDDAVLDLYWMMCFGGADGGES